MATTIEIIETTDNRRYAVRDAGPGLEHVWLGTEVKKLRGSYVPKAKAREHLIRKAGCRIIQASFDTVEEFGAALASTLPEDVPTDYELFGSARIR